MARHRRRRLTLPSRGRATSGFASCRPPLMSNVRHVGKQWRTLLRHWGGIYQTGRQAKVVSSVNAHAFGSAVQAEPPSLCTRDPFRANRTPNGLRWPSVPLRWRAANPCAPLRPSFALPCTLEPWVQNSLFPCPTASMPNPSIEGTCNIWLRQLSPAPHVKR